MASNSSTLYNGLFIVNGNVLMGNNVASAGPLDYPAGSTRLFYSGDDFLDTKGQYYTGTHLQLKAQGVKTTSGGVAQGGSIFLEGGREKGGINTHGSIQFLTGGFEAMRVASNGYVGINVSTPMYNLDVNGNTNISWLLNVSTISTGNISATGNLQTTGTIVSGTFLSANPGGIITFGDILGRNISGTNITAGGTISASGNITAGGNISTSGAIVATGNIATIGNISGNKFLGDGSLLTNLPSKSNLISTLYSVSYDSHHVSFPRLVLPTQQGVYMFFLRAGDNNPQGHANITFILSVFTNIDGSTGKSYYTYTIPLRVPSGTYYNSDTRITCGVGAYDSSYLLKYNSYTPKVNQDNNGRTIYVGTAGFSIDASVDIPVDSNIFYYLDLDYWYINVDATFQWYAYYSKIL